MLNGSELNNLSSTSRSCCWEKLKKQIIEDSNKNMKNIKMNDITKSHPPPAIRQFEEVLPDVIFNKLINAVRSIGNDRLKQNYTTTFWFPRDSEPTNIAEVAVVELLKLADPPAQCTGIEWWLGRLGPGEKLRYHFDRDMTIRKKTGLFVHPLYASVFYLNTFPSSPTVILDQVPSADGKSRIPAKPQHREAVQAVENRYVVFPGNLRHGVIPDADKSKNIDPQENEQDAEDFRLTLLVNYWDRRPLPPICFDYDGSIYGQLKNEVE